jgi:predicted membrane GTPase involved in stress response
MEYIDVDELVEIVPDTLRIRKAVLGPGRSVKRSASVEL